MRKFKFRFTNQTWSIHIQEQNVDTKVVWKKLAYSNVKKKIGLSFKKL